MTITESALDHAFAEAFASGDEFQRWLLSGGRFARFASCALLLSNEQAQARPKARHWWKHWWCRLPDGSESETDIFLVFKAGGGRFALHIENKPVHGVLGLRQAADYRRRAALKANEAGWLSYSDFETILLAPANFLTCNAVCLQQFDRGIRYEEVARFVPLFSAALLG
jgi:hypothetical protein